MLVLYEESVGRAFLDYRKVRPIKQERSAKDAHLADKKERMKR